MLAKPSAFLLTGEQIVPEKENAVAVVMETTTTRNTGADSQHARLGGEGTIPTETRHLRIQQKQNQILNTFPGGQAPNGFELHHVVSVVVEQMTSPQHQ